MRGVKGQPVETGGAANLRQVAARAGVSVSAASAVLNAPQANTRISEETRRRILGVAAELNYTPNAVARGLKQRRTQTVGVLFGWSGQRALRSQYSVSMLDGVVEGAGDSGYHVLLYTKRWHDAAAAAAAFADQRTDGVVVVAPPDDPDSVPTLIAGGRPVVVVSSVPGLPDVPYVTIDNREGAAIALEHLRSLGHTRIAYATTARNRHSLRLRYDAYRSWMAERGLAVPDAHVLDALPASDGTPDDLPRRVAALMRLPAGERPTALFAATDDLAARILDALRGAGFAAPGDLSVVGFDDVPVASLTTPKLTTVHQPLFEMGRLAARLLVARIEGREEATGGPAHVLNPQLVVRESTTAPPGVEAAGT
jgi:LacI family transcriptional regulator